MYSDYDYRISEGVFRRMSELGCAASDAAVAFALFGETVAIYQAPVISKDLDVVNSFRPVHGFRGLLCFVDYVKLHTILFKRLLKTVKNNRITLIRKQFMQLTTFSNLRF